LGEPPRHCPLRPAALATSPAGGGGGSSQGFPAGGGVEPACADDGFAHDERLGREFGEGGLEVAAEGNPAAAAFVDVLVVKGGLVGVDPGGKRSLDLAEAIRVLLLGPLPPPRGQVGVDPLVLAGAGDDDDGWVVAVAPEEAVVKPLVLG